LPTIAMEAPARGDVHHACSAGAQPCGCAGAAQGAQEASIAAVGTTYLLGLGELGDDRASLAWLHVGARLLLRRRLKAGPCAWAKRSCVEVRAPDGRFVGQLPPDGAEAIAPLLDAGVSVTARVSALVPAFRRQRVQLTVEADEIGVR
jgi:hypothetical protein